VEGISESVVRNTFQVIITSVLWLEYHEIDFTLTRIKYVLPSRSLRICAFFRCSLIPGIYIIGNDCPIPRFYIIIFMLECEKLIYNDINAHVKIVFFGIEIPWFKIAT